MTSTPKDTIAAKISLSGKRTQRFTRKGTIVVTVRCNEECAARVQASIRAGKLFRSKRVTKRLAAAKRVKFALKFSKGATRRILRSLRRKKRLSANVAIDTRDRVGNASNAKRTLRLKR